MLKPLHTEVEGKPTTIKCRHADVWPPSLMRFNLTPDDLRARGVITEATYQKLQTWARVCGLLEMQEGKCLSCPLAMFDPAPRPGFVYAPIRTNTPKRRQ